MINSIQVFFLKVFVTLLPLMISGIVTQMTTNKLAQGGSLALGLAGSCAIAWLFWKNRPASGVSRRELQRRAELMEDFNSSYRNVTVSGIGISWISVEAHCTQLAQLPDTDHIWQLMAQANDPYALTLHLPLF